MAKNSKKKEQKKSDEPRRLSECKTLPQLKSFLEASTKPTNKMDLLLLQGGRVSELLKAFDKVRGEESKDFKSASKLKAHIRHRQKAGWTFDEKHTDSQDRYFKLTKIA